MRCACEKARGIIWKKRRECRRHGVSKLVLLDAIPNVKQENTPRSEHSTYFSIRSGLLRKEHYAELTYDRVECAIFEGKVHGIRLTPVNRARRAKRRGMVDHWLIQVRGYNRYALGQLGCHGAGYDTCPRCNFKHPCQGSQRQPRREVRRVWLEDQRNQVLVVKFRNRTGEDFVGLVAVHFFWPPSVVSQKSLYHRGG